MLSRRDYIAKRMRKVAAQVGSRRRDEDDAQHRPAPDVPKPQHPQTRTFTCPYCGYAMETDDRYGCANCLAEGLN